MGDYITKTMLIFFFVAMGVGLVAGQGETLFNNYFDEKINIANDDWFNIIRNSFLSFESVAGAVALGTILFASGASSPLVISGAILGSIIGILLDAMNIVNVVALPLTATYVVVGIFTIMLIAFILRFIRGT